MTWGSSFLVLAWLVLALAFFKFSVAFIKFPSNHTIIKCPVFSNFDLHLIIIICLYIYIYIYINKVLIK